jgi:hypothetical protein
MKNKGIEDIIGDAYVIAKKTIDIPIQHYNKAYEKYPGLTNLISTYVGVQGGDTIAKQFTSERVPTGTDLLFNVGTAAVYSILAQKMMDFSTALTNKISERWTYLKKHRVAHHAMNTMILVTEYIPLNMLYWISSSIKNNTPLTKENLGAGLAVVLMGSAYYLGIEYIAVSKLNNPKKTRWLRPFYSASEIVYNSLFAGSNYFIKKH